MAVNLGKGTIGIGLDDQTKSGLNKIENNAGKTASNIEDKFKKLGSVIAAAFAGTAIFDAMKTLSTAALTFAGDLKDMSDGLQISADKLNALGYAGLQSGVNMGKLQNILVTLQDKLLEAQNGSENAQKAFSQLKINFVTSSVEDALDKLLELGNAGELTGANLSALNDILGKKLVVGVKQLSSIINSTWSAMNLAGEDGVAITNKQIDAVANLGDKIDALKQASTVSFIYGLTNKDGLDGGEIFDTKEIQKAISEISLIIGKAVKEIAEKVTSTIEFIKTPIGQVTVEIGKISAALWALNIVLSSRIIKSLAVFGVTIDVLRAKSIPFKQMLKEFPILMSKVGAESLTLGATFTGLGNIFKNLGFIVLGFFNSVKAAIMANPITAAIVAIIAVVTILYTMWKSKQEEMEERLLLTAAKVAGRAREVVELQRQKNKLLEDEAKEKKFEKLTDIEKIASINKEIALLNDKYKIEQKTIDLIYKLGASDAVSMEKQRKSLSAQLDLLKEIDRLKDLRTSFEKTIKPEELQDWQKSVEQLKIEIVEKRQNEIILAEKLLEVEKAITKEWLLTKNMDINNLKLKPIKLNYVDDIVKIKTPEVEKLEKVIPDSFYLFEEISKNLKDNVKQINTNKLVYESFVRMFEKGQISKSVLDEVENILNIKKSPFEKMKDEWIGLVNDVKQMSLLKAIKSNADGIMKAFGAIGDVTKNVFAAMSDVMQQKIDRITNQLDSLRSNWDSEKASLEEAGLLNTIFYKEKEEFVKAEESRLKRSAENNWKRQKSMQVSIAEMNAIQASLAAFTSVIGTPFIGPILAPIAAAAALVAGMANVKSIQQQPMPKFAMGGYIDGNKYGDNIPLMAQGGEFIVNRSATEANRNLLSSINNGTYRNSESINITINNPVGETNWVENNLIPELNKAFKRNVNMSFAR